MKRVIGPLAVVAALVATVALFVYFAAPLGGQGSVFTGAGRSPAPVPVQPFRLENVSPLSAPGSAQLDSGPAPKLEDWAAQSGIQFAYHTDARTDRMFLPENMGGGAGWLDFDGDGLEDLFLTNGCRLPADLSDREHVQKLFRQEAVGRFVEIGPFAQVDLNRYGQGCAIGDVDNDGFPDVYLACYGPNVMLRNQGDGTFSDLTEQAELRDGGWSTSAAFGDLDLDGDLDLYVVHYAVTSLETNPICYSVDGKVRVYCGPKHYDPEPDSLFANRGDGSFGRANQEFGCDVTPAPGLGVVIADLDNDHWPDVYVANDMYPNFLFHNYGQKPARARMEEVAMQQGAAVSGDGRPEASMGVACADFDNNEHFDLFLTHYYQEKNTYYQNHGNLRFDDHSYASGLAAPSLDYLGFGVVPIDYDLDGLQDLFISNGHVLGKSVRPFAMRPQLFRNAGQARFKEVSHRASSYFFDEWVGRGVAAADYDNDGDEDLLVVHHDDRPVALLRNNTRRAGKVLGLNVSGVSGNRDGYGTLFEIRVGERVCFRQICGGGSYLSASDRRMLIGVPDNVGTVAVKVHWPSGAVAQRNELAVDAYWRLVEGREPSRELNLVHSSATREAQVP